tara:strand:+ start:120 stop:647 length:528 start_codon:yes stop_codon:yes gene_type:complete
VIDIKQSKETGSTLQRLDKLSVELKTKAVASGLTAAAKPIKAMMKATAPADTGKLRQAINQLRVSARASRRLDLFGETQTLAPGQVAILIGPNKKVQGKRRAGIANMLEFGTKAHEIKPRKMNLFLRIGATGIARKVRHPGIKANPFMQRALDANASTIQANFVQGVGKRIDKLL